MMMVMNSLFLPGGGWNNKPCG